MKLCAKLTTDINFEPDAIQPCCNTNDLKDLPRFPFHGERVNMTEYTKHILETIQQMQEDSGMCAGCPELVEVMGEATQVYDVALKFRNVSINKHRFLCNCRCTYCSLWKGKRDSYAILPAIKSLHVQDVLEKDCRFSWGGGESSILPEFDDTCRWLLRYGYPQYIHTNALRHSRAISELLNLSGGRLNISLDSGSPEIYRTVKGVDGFDKVVTNLRQYIKDAAGAYLFDLKYIVFDLNNSISEIDRFLALCSELNITNIQLSLNFIEVNQSRVSDKTLQAVSYFKTKAQSLGLNCLSFFITEKYQKRISELVKNA